MKKNYVLMIVGSLFFLTLTYFSIWWIVLSILVGLICIAYKIHGNLINKIEAAKSELESELSEKTEQLEKGLRDEKILRNKIEEVQQSKTVVLNKISHQIRTPMNSMIGMASLLEETSLNKEQKEYLETIISCGRNMIPAINDILLKDLFNNSHERNGKPLLDETDFSIRDCIEDALDFFSANAEKIGTELIYEIGYDVPEQIVGDKGRLRQVLLKLIENALKYSEAAEVLVKVSLIKTEKKGKINLAFQVKDTGSGISENMLQKINMNLSYQNNPDMIQTDDIGVGLIISDKLVKIMGGKLLLNSNMGKGTLVSFNIIVGPSALSHKRNAVEIPVGLAGKKILLVVNNLLNGDILCNHLAHWKIIPVLARSGKQALEILSTESSFDLLITDFKLSDTDGIQLAQEIHEQNSALPSILINGFNDEGYKKYPGLFKSILPRPIRHSIFYNQILAALTPQQQNISKEQNGSSLLSDKFSEKYPMHILIAEDNPMNQLFAVKILNRLGYKPEVAKNGKEVLEMVSHEHFDMILMDVEMPEMDGLEATRMIRLCLESQPVIIAMTANAMQGDREKCLQSGMDDYLSKPVELNELLRILEKWALTAKESL